MAERPVNIGVRNPTVGVCVLDVAGVLGGAARRPLLDACGGAQALVLNLGDVQIIEPPGVSLLIELQARARARKQRLLAYGLTPPVTQVFALTQLDEALELFPDEAQVLAATGASEGSPGRQP
jgi:anti-anti-sigma regulatory factor